MASRSPLAGVNLNLFPVLDALFRHGSVTRAASELGVTQSAVSHSLRELRAVLDDDVFVRTSRGMEPTPRARALRPAVRAALEALESSLTEAPGFDPAASARTFRLATADDIGSTILPVFARELVTAAPSISLDIRARTADATTMLERNESDLVFALETALGAGIASAPLYTDDFSCVVRRDHPDVGARLSLARFAALPHILVSPDGYGRSPVDDALAALGRARRIQLYTRYFMTAPELAAATDCVLTMPTGLAHAAARHLPIRVLRPPIELAPFTVVCVWSQAREDAGLRWFRDTLHRAAQGLNR